MAIETREEMKIKVETLLDTNACKEVKDSAEEWLKAGDAAAKEVAADKLIAELDDAVTPIDKVIQFFESGAADERFGKEQAVKIATHMRRVKERGGTYCDCPACTVGLEILKAKELLKG